MEETAACELEAAEVLAGLSRSSAANGAATSDPEVQVVVATSSNPQVQTTAYEHTTVTANQEQTSIVPQFTETLPSNHLCSTSYRSKRVVKSRSKLTEVEKEERRVRRILANRESARQAIRRRQAMYLELKGKAKDVLEENASLKKKKELALKEYASLKEGNEFLKAQIVKIDKAKQRETQANSATPSTSTAPPSHKQPPLIPCVWPSVVPYTDLLQLQHSLSHSNNNTTPHPLQESDACINTGQGIPVFVIPVPWLISFLSHNVTTHLPHPSTDQSQSTPHQSTADVSARVDNLHHHGNIGTSKVPTFQQQGSYSAKTAPGFTCSNVGSSGTRLFEGPGCTRNKRAGENGPDINPSESGRQRSLLLQRKNQKPVLCRKKKDEATEVRRRRKELMKMKYLRFHRDKKCGAHENKESGFS